MLRESTLENSWPEEEGGRNLLLSGVPGKEAFSLIPDSSEGRGEDAFMSCCL